MDIKVDKIQKSNSPNTSSKSFPEQKERIAQNGSIFSDSPTLSVDMNYSEKKDSVDIFTQESFNKKLKTDYGIFNNTVNIKNQETPKTDSGTLTFSDNLKFSSNINEQINQENTLSASITSRGKIEDHKAFLKQLNSADDPKLPDLNTSLRLSDSQKFGFKPDKNNEIYTKLTASGSYSSMMTMGSLSSENGINNNLTLNLGEQLPPLNLRNSASINLSYSNMMRLKKDPTESFTTSFGLSSAVFFKPVQNFDVSISGNGKYSIKNDNTTSISYGAGLNMSLKPIEDKKDFKVSFGMMYSNSEGQSQNQTQMMGQQTMGPKKSLALSAGIDFNKNVSINSKYQIDLENDNNDTFSLGSKIKF